MKKITIIILGLMLFSVFVTKSQTKIHPTYYAVYFKDKKGTQFTIDKPEMFLSQKSIDRRKKFGIPVDNIDLPINKNYVKQVKDLGFNVIKTSKWLNCAIIFAEDTTNFYKIKALSFVMEKPTPKTKKYKPAQLKPSKIKVEPATTTDKYNYGKAANQNKMLKINFLHNMGFDGKGVTMAILDGGFLKVDKLPSYDSLWANKQILGWYDYVDMDTTVFDDGSHGMMVLSTIGGNTEGLVGTAPKASFWLFTTEDGDSEYPIEEYNYVIASEFADSVGVDLIHASLGYSNFDGNEFDYKYSTLDGNTAISSIGADIAASRGILVTTSAGNEGNDPWKYISAPADADSCLAVGAVNFKSNYASFSSLGPSFDGRIKPEVTAQGQGSAVQGEGGRITSADGTSFSGPIMAGAIACLIQAFPDKTNMQIIRAVQQNANYSAEPNTKYGYGIPDFYRTYYFLKKQK